MPRYRACRSSFCSLSRYMLQEKQRTLVIAGVPRLTVWPQLGLALDRVTLSEHASDAEFAA